MSTESDFDYMIENDWCSADDEHEIAKETLKEIACLFLEHLLAPE